MGASAGVRVVLCTAGTMTLHQERAGGSKQSLQLGQEIMRSTSLVRGTRSMSSQAWARSTTRVYEIR